MLTLAAECASDLACFDLKFMQQWPLLIKRSLSLYRTHAHKLSPSKGDRGKSG